MLIAEMRHDGNAVYYVTAAKEYGRKPFPECDVLVQFSAIIVRDQRGHVSSPNVNAYTAFDCGGGNILGFQPLASVHWAGPLLWLIRVNADDGFSYSLIDPLQPKGSEYLQLKREWQ